MIQKVSFLNFKAYRSLELDLESFTVLVGPNASGKTTLLRGLDTISNLGAFAVGSEGFDPLTRVSPDVRSFGSNQSVEMRVSGEWSGTKGTFVATSSSTAPEIKAPPGQGDVSGRDFKLTGTWGGTPFVIGGPRQSGVYDPPLEAFRMALSSTQVLRFEPQRLADASYSEDITPRVQHDGRGLASVLAHLKLSRDEVFDQIELALKQVVPSVRRIRIERASVDQMSMRTIALDEQKHLVPEKRTLWGQKIVFDMKGAKGVPADMAGEGTLMTLGLLTVLMGPTHPRLVLLDDIEMGLHPAAQGKLIKVLRGIQERDPGVQIIATSHSPFILNHLDPREVRLTYLAENGFACCEKMTAHPQFDRWKDLMSPGEFWSSIGESWVEKVAETTDHE